MEVVGGECSQKRDTGSILELSNGLENVQIKVSTAKASDKCEIKFKYTAENVAGPAYKQDPSELTFDGCDCATFSCGLQCPCITAFGPNYDDRGRLLSITTDSCYPYVKPTFECNGSCQCGDACKNRVVQNGVNVQLEVFITKSKGWGLRTLQHIDRGQFVCEYAGEILDKSEAQSRTDAKSLVDMNYLLILKEHAKKDTEITYIDPTFIGNVGRFINHSCAPNLEVVPVRVNNQIPRAALFAKCDISSGEELSYSYHGELEFTRDEIQNSKPCFCNSDKCRKYLPHNLFAFK